MLFEMFRHVQYEFLVIIERFILSKNKNICQRLVFLPVSKVRTEFVFIIRNHAYINIVYQYSASTIGRNELFTLQLIKK